MNSTTRPSSKIRRYAASVVATAAVAVGGVACGTETVDDVEPAAPAQVKVPATSRSPRTPRSTSRKERYEALKRHYTQPADSHKAAERNTENEQQAARSGPSRHMGRPGPGF